MIRRRVFPVLSITVLILGALACNFGSSAGAGPTSAAGGGASTPSGGGASGSGACANPYFPVVVGMTWNYSITGPFPATFTRSITGVKADGFTVENVFSTSAGTKVTDEWKCDNGALVDLQPDAANSATLQSKSMTANFHTTALSGVTLPANPKPGDTWKQNLTLEGTESINGQEIPAKSVVAFDCKAGGTESVTVPAGTFDALRTDCQVDDKITVTMNGASVPVDLPFTATVWYAKGIGMVKTAETISGSGEIDILLTSSKMP